MNLHTLVKGTAIALPDILDAREQRAYLQKKLLEEYGLPLVSFTLNIAGPIKVFPLTVATYEEGVSAIKSHCMAYGLPILHFEETRESTGYEGFFVIQADALKIKKVLSRLETNSTLGRLYDIDVIQTDGEKISRTSLDLPERQCLLCSQPTFVCSRARTHSVDALVAREVEIMWDYFTLQYARKIASYGARALLYEVIATPKPGLVDKANTGSHSDMDIFTFETSSLALLPYFTGFVQCGISYWDSPSYERVFQEIRPLGRQAEIDMLHATHGVNTHKGIIFSLGIICAALGCLYGQQISYSRKELRQICSQMTASLADDFAHVTSDTAVTNGEKLYAAHGLMGIRGEAMNGYPILFETALPAFCQYLQDGYSQNDAGVLTLLHIMSVAEDSNIIARSNYETMCEVQRVLQEHLKTDTPDQLLALAHTLDEEFIKKNISPGGSADILAMTYFIYFFEQEL